MDSLSESRGQIEALKRLVAALVLAYGQPLDDSGNGYAVDIPSGSLLESTRWTLYELPTTTTLSMRVVIAKDGAHLGRLEPPRLLNDAFDTPR